MARLAFNKPGATSMVQDVPTPVSEVTVETVTTVSPAVNEQPSPGLPAVAAPLPPPAPANPFSDEEDSFDPGDLVLPRLSIVQKVGELSNIYTPGDIVLTGQNAVVLADAGKGENPSSPVRILVLHLQRTLFVEKMEGGLRGRTFQTELQVAQAGGTTEYEEHKATDKPLFQRSVTALVLIEKPENVPASDVFPHEFGGKHYALALYTMKGTSYTNAARHFKTAKKLGPVFQRNGYRGAFWTFASKLKKFGGNYAFIPLVNKAEDTSDELRAAIKSSLGL